MPPHRVHTAELARLLNSAKQPIYVLDEELTIVFLNRAAQEWLGAEESLAGPAVCLPFQPRGGRAGRRGRRAVSAAARSSRARRAVATVSRPAEDGRLIERRASFLPIGVEAEGLLGVLAVVGRGRSTAGVRRRRSGAADGRSRADRLARTGAAFPPGGRRAVSGRSADRPGAGHAAGPAAGRIGRRQPVERAVGRSARQRPPTPGRRDPLCRRKGDSPIVQHPRTFRQLDCPFWPAHAGAVGLFPAGRRPARSGRRGRLRERKLLDEQTAPGTLLLHRVDELSADVQVELAGFFVAPPARLGG